MIASAELQRVEMGVQPISTAETAVAAVTAREQAHIQSAYIVALQRPRKWMDVRARILEHCDRPGFAERARYKKPTGKAKINGQWVQTYAEGLSVRFAEAARAEMGNLRCETEVTYEDDKIRIVKASILDLERNNYEARSIAINKITEKRGVQDKKTGEWGPPEGREVLGQRLNTYGEPVYMCVATEDELRLRMNSEISKAQRDETLRLIPKDIRDDAEERVQKTLNDPKKVDPATARKRMLDAFMGINILPSDLETYIGTPMDKLSPAQVNELRGLYAAIAEGQTTFDQAHKARNDTDGSRQEQEAEKARKLAELQAGAKPDDPTTSEGDPDDAELKRRLAEEKAHEEQPKRTFGGLGGKK